MTYRHKREKCAQETKEILEDVLKAKNEEYGCLDCAKTIRVGNPMEKILSEEISMNDLKSQAESIIEETQSEKADEIFAEGQVDSLEKYTPSDEMKLDNANSLEGLKKKKKGGYVEFKKDYRG